MRIAVLGANGQVGAELCLLLRNQPDVELAPVCRNPLGSAFLRWKGVPPRHGMPADPAQAGKLFGDCDLIANLALGAGTSREAHEINLRLIENSVRFARPGARVIYFSTISVYGDAWKSNYGREKRRCEIAALRMASRAGREMYVLRLGHVMGELQNITALIRDEIRERPVYLPAPDRRANATYTVNIADAVLRIARGLERPGLYDLQTVPPWTWRQVYEHEARTLGFELRLAEESGSADRTPARRRSAKQLVRRMVGALGRSRPRREFGLKLLASLSPRTNRRLQAIFYTNRAAAEAAALKQCEVATDALLWREVGSRFLATLAPTRDLLADPLYQIQSSDAAASWPADLPLATT